MSAHHSQDSQTNSASFSKPGASWVAVLGQRCQALQRSLPGPSTRKHWKAQEPATAWPPTSFTSRVPEGRALGEWTLRGPATGCDTDFPFPGDPEA